MDTQEKIKGHVRKKVSPVRMQVNPKTILHFLSDIGMSHHKFCKKIGCADAYIRNCANGKKGLSPKYAIKIIQATQFFGVDKKFPPESLIEFYDKEISEDKKKVLLRALRRTVAELPDTKRELHRVFFE